ncbi:LuxR C-terminal-related transcriptional regulator [Nonomuraea jabiensis]|uniref:LuxR C-terminal-related transcriptional regulator n=1 Tax=Nonomuraea jabiensis TaxID=882448 RepID=UPI0036AE34CD
MGRTGVVTYGRPIDISQREAEVLAALGARMSNAQIAGRLHISVRTVESHISSLLRKYGVADRWALADEALRQSPPPGHLTGLPAPRTAFFGRAAEQDLALGLLGKARLVTLLGAGGIGKTRLAVAVAESAAPSFPLGGAFVDLVPARDGFVAQAVASALGVTERPGQTLEDAIARHLGRGQSLLVLDNCEHLVDAVAAFTERLLSGCATGRDDAALVAAAFADFPPQDWYRPYARAAGAELAVAAGLPDAAVRLAAALSDTAAENDWAAACLARAAGRLHHDPDELSAAAEAWERIGARYERACTLLLIPARQDEARKELAALRAR